MAEVVTTNDVKTLWTLIVDGYDIMVSFIKESLKLKLKSNTRPNTWRNSLTQSDSSHACCLIDDWKAHKRQKRKTAMLLPRKEFL